MVGRGETTAAAAAAALRLKNRLATGVFIATVPKMSKISPTLRTFVP